MSAASTNDVGAGACIKSVEVFFDGFNAQYCELFGKYHIRVRDLIIGMCIENPNLIERKSRTTAYKNASQKWIKMKEDKFDMLELQPYLQNYQFEGEINSFYYLKRAFTWIRNGPFCYIHIRFLFSYYLIHFTI
jgi:hypothetical protein